jgi:ankyrin repeat protein
MLKIKLLVQLFALLFFCNYSYSQTLLSVISKGDTIQLKMMLESGVDVNERDEKNYYPMYWATRQRSSEDKNYNEVIELLKKHGARDFNEELLFFFDFCEEGNIDSVKKYVEKGFDINSRYVWFDSYENDSGCDCYLTPISHAAKFGNPELVKYLFQNGAEINFDYNGVQPLGEAIKTRNYEIAKFLIENGADKNVTFSLDEQYYANAICTWDRTIDTIMFDFLIENEFPYGYYKNASPVGLISAINDALHMKKLIPFLEYKDISEALCFSQTIEMTDYLLNNGADINYIYVSSEEEICREFKTVLNNAVLTSNIDFVSFLIEKNAEINNTDKYQDSTIYGCDYQIRTPLMIAIDQNDTEIISLLLNSNANVNTIFHYGISDSYVSPLILAVQQNNFENVKILLEQGAALENNEISIFDYITDKTDEKIINLLNENKK